jgi:hypothetical protein
MCVASKSRIVQIVDANDDNKIDHWIIAATKARKEIAKARARICSLEKSVEICVQKSKAGEPWPTTQIATRN